MSLNLRHFNEEVTLNHTNSYYLKHFDETFLKCREVLVLSLPLHSQFVLYLFPRVYISLFFILFGNFTDDKMSRDWDLHIKRFGMRNI